MSQKKLSVGPLLDAEGHRIPTLQQVDGLQLAWELGCDVSTLRSCVVVQVVSKSLLMSGT